MESQYGCGLENDRDFLKPIFNHEKGKESKIKSIKGSQLWCSFLATIDYDELLPGKHGFGHNSFNTAGLKWLEQRENEVIG